MSVKNNKYNRLFRAHASAHTLAHKYVEVGLGGWNETAETVARWSALQGRVRREGEGEFASRCAERVLYSIKI